LIPSAPNEGAWCNDSTAEQDTSIAHSQHTDRVTEVKKRVTSSSTLDPATSYGGMPSWGRLTLLANPLVLTRLWFVNGIFQYRAMTSQTGDTQRPELVTMVPGTERTESKSSSEG
jgi:hypothetical protein